jgi:hypothetical protein
MPPAGFEPTNSAGERPHTYALDRAITRTDLPIRHSDKFQHNQMYTIKILGKGKGKVTPLQARCGPEGG